jgi:maltose O-acetyltransferase
VPELTHTERLVPATHACDDFINHAIRYPGAIAMRIRRMRLRLLGVQMGHRCWIRRISVPRNPWDIRLGDGVSLDDHVVLLTIGSRAMNERLTIGDGTYVNRFTMFDASERIEVGNNCLIGPFCYITDHDHGTAETGGLMREQPLISKPVRIGCNVWIGAGATILKGVTIGDGAVIAAGAVVTRPVNAKERMAGVPAEPLKRS